MTDYQKYKQECIGEGIPRNEILAYWEWRFVRDLLIKLEEV